MNGNEQHLVHLNNGVAQETKNNPFSASRWFIKYLYMHSDGC